MMIKSFLWVLVFGLLMQNLSAQEMEQQTDSMKTSVVATADDEEGEVRVNLTTPYHAVLTHLAFLQSDNFFPEKSAEALDVDDPASEESKLLASQLIQILDGKGLYVDLDIIPTNPNYIDSASGKHKFSLFTEYPQIYVQKSGGLWTYSRRTVRLIPKMHADVFPYGTGKLLNLFPKSGQKEFLGLQIWQYAGFAMLIVFAWLLHKVLTWVFGLILRLLANRFGQEKIAKEFIAPIAKPVSLLLIAMVLLILIPVLQLPVQLTKYLVLALRGLAPLFIMLIVYRLVDLLSAYVAKLAEKTETSLDDHLVPLIRKVVKFIVVIAGIIFVLQNLNINVTALAAILSIGALGLGLASADTVRNLFGSIMIFLDRPFQIGDWVTVAGTDGTIEEVGIRSTRIRTFHNSVVSIPNGQMADLMIDNMGSRLYRRFNTKIAVTYDTPPHLIAAFVEGLKEIVLNHPDTRKDVFEIHLNGLGDSSLLILFYIFFRVPDWSRELRSRQEVLLAIINLADELGVRFAFPTQTLHIEDFPEKKTLTPVITDSAEDLKNKVSGFLEKWKQEIKG